MTKPKTILQNKHNQNTLLIMEDFDKINDLMLDADADKKDFIYLHILGYGKHKFTLDGLSNDYTFTKYIAPDYYDNFLEFQWVESKNEYHGNTGIAQLRDYLNEHPNCRVVRWQVNTCKNQYDETVETVFAQVRSNDPFEFI